MLMVISLVCIGSGDDVGSDMLLQFSVLIEEVTATRIGSCDFVICITGVGCRLL